MTAQTNAFTTFAAIGNREDLTNVIYNIDPTKTPLLNSIGKSRAKSVLHEWQTDTLAAASSSNAQVEGFVVTGSASTPTTRLSNYCQISMKDVVVSGTQEAVDKAGRDSEMGLQIAKRGKELKRDMETILCSNNPGVVGTTATGRQLRGLEAWLRTNTNRYTGSTSGTKGKSATANGTTHNATDAGNTRAFTEALLKKVVAQLFSSGGEPEFLMVGPHNKQVASTFTGRTSTRQNVDEDTIMGAAQVYATDFGEIRIVPNLFSRERSALLIDPNYLAVSYLRPIRIKDLAVTGDSERKFLFAEYTLEMRNEKAQGVIADINTTS